MTFFAPFAAGAASGMLAQAIDQIPTSIPYAHREEQLTFELFVKQRAAWQTAFNGAVAGGLRVRYGAVFCHQKPYARFTCNGTGARRELGDALVVLSFITSTERRRAALLLQAKKVTLPAKLAAAGIAAAPFPQWHLYTQWPPFTHSADFVPGCQRQLGQGGGSLSRARHLLLSRHGAGMAGATAVPDGSAPPVFRSVLALGDTVAATFAGGIACRTTWELRPAWLPVAHSHWSAVVAAICEQVRNARAGAWASPGNPGAARGIGTLRFVQPTVALTGVGTSGANSGNAGDGGTALVSIIAATADADVDLRLVEAEILGPDQTQAQGDR